MLLDVTLFILQSVVYFLGLMISFSFDHVNLFALTIIVSISVYAIRMLLFNRGSGGVTKHGDSNN